MSTNRRRFGLHAVWVVGAPWFSLGIHVDWHTPTIDVHFAKGSVQVGRNQWDGERRISVSAHRSSGHTSQCMCGDVWEVPL